MENEQPKKRTFKEKVADLIYKILQIVNIIYACYLTYSIIKMGKTYYDKPTIFNMIILILSILAFIASIVLIIIGLQRGMDKAKKKAIKKPLKSFKKILKIFVTLITLYVAIQTLYLAHKNGASVTEITLAWTSIGSNLLSLLLTYILYYINKTTKKVVGNIKESAVELKQSAVNKKENIKNSFSSLKDKLTLKKKENEGEDNVEQTLDSTEDDTNGEDTICEKEEQQNNNNGDDEAKSDSLRNKIANLKNKIFCKDKKNVQ